VAFELGHWWYFEPAADRAVMLDPLFAECSWNVGALSDRLEIGTRMFTRMVEDSLGVNAKIWLRNIRIVKACHLLREGGKIQRVARCVGFSHASELTREFKQLVGVSPSFYKRSERTRRASFNG
jgi:AraC-like DNA-binding protein